MRGRGEHSNSPGKGTMVRGDTLVDGCPEAEVWPGRKESKILKIFPGSPHTPLNRPGEQNFLRETEWNIFIKEGLPGAGPSHPAGSRREEAETPSRPVGPWASGMMEEDKGIGRLQQSEKASRARQMHRRN